MSDRSLYFIYYTEANIVCLILFAIMLIRDIIIVDRQEKQIRYDHALIAFMLYFACDVVWAAVIAGKLPRNRLTVVSTNFGNCVLMAAITYTWLRYVMAVEQAANRNRGTWVFAIQLPFILSTVALIGTYLCAPQVLVNEALELQPAYSAFQIAVPCVYIAAVVTYATRKARSEENPIERRKHLFIGFFPLMVVAGGLAQILLLPEVPMFCFSSTILMLVFYIYSMENQISKDPLTGLNNRGQLIHYTAQKSNLRRENRRTFVVMIDINDFKQINDTYGHAEGDRALVLLADALRDVVRSHGTPMFLARYGGDEFTLIVHPTEEGEIPALIVEIRNRIEARCRAADAPYLLSIGAGCDELAGADDTFLKCMQRADNRLYLDKAYQKARRTDM